MNVSLSAAAFAATLPPQVLLIVVCSIGVLALLVYA
jgi:hypothetical protein